MSVVFVNTRLLPCLFVSMLKLENAPHHAVHGEVVVLRLQLNSVLVVPSDLCVAGEEEPLVVHDPVEHL